MSKRINATKADIKAMEYCPVCMRLYTPIEYYTGQIVSQRRYAVDSSTSCKETVYRNVTKHIGGLCRWCAKANLKRTAKVWAIIGAIGLLSCAAGIVIPFLLPPQSRQGFRTVSVLLGVFGGLAFLIGGSVLLHYVCTRPGSDTNYNKAFGMFMTNLRKDKRTSPGLGYMSKYAAKRLRVK